MNVRQASHLVHALLMQANVAGRLPLACKGAGQSIEPWPPEGGEPMSYYNSLDHVDQTITFVGPDGSRKFRIIVEEA